MVILDGFLLIIVDVVCVLFDFEEVVVFEESMECVKKSRVVVEWIVYEEKMIYGIIIGFGKFSDVLI